MKNETKTQVMNAAADLFETLYGGDISAETRKKLYTSIIDILDPLIEEAYEEDEKPKNNASVDYSLDTLTSLKFNTYVSASDYIDKMNNYVKATGSISIANIFSMYDDMNVGSHLTTSFSDYSHGFTEPGFAHLSSRDVADGRILIKFDLDLIKKLS